MSMETQWQTAKLEDVIRYYEKGFEPKQKGDKIFSVSHYVDPVQGEVVFRIHVDKSPNNQPG